MAGGCLGGAVGVVSLIEVVLVGTEGLDGGGTVGRGGVILGFFVGSLASVVRIVGVPKEFVEVATGGVSFLDSHFGW